MTDLKEYHAFLETKKQVAISSGFEKSKAEMCAAMFEWQKDIVFWALKKGRCALFEDCGLGKTIQSLEWSRSVSEHCQKPVLIVCPLSVAEQTKREGEKFGFAVTVVRDQKHVKPGINVTNYEMLDHFDASEFCDIVLDPFNGIASTGYKALIMGRKYVGVELKESYYNVSIKNLQTAEDENQINQSSLFAEDGDGCGIF